MKLGLYALTGTLGLALLGCQPSVEYTPTQQRAAGLEKSSENQTSTADQTPAEETQDVAQEEAQEEVAEEGMEEEQVAEQPAAPAPTPLTNADLLAMDTVVITAVATAAPEGTKWYSDVGNLKVTTAADAANAGALPAGAELKVDATFMVKVDQKVEFCNHASSTDTVRIHAANGSAFNHWPAAAVLQPGQCSFNDAFPEDINEAAVGNTPGNNIYNHQQNEDNSPIFLQVMP